MKEAHFAYRITGGSSGLECTDDVIEKNTMLELLEEIQKIERKGLFWIFKQLENHPKEPLCIIDCEFGRVYYHFSGDVENMKEALKKLTK